MRQRGLFVNYRDGFLVISSQNPENKQKQSFQRNIFDTSFWNIQKIYVALQWRIQDFPQGGEPTPKSAIIFQFFPQKLHENEGIWTPGGREERPWRPP